MDVFGSAVAAGGDFLRAATLDAGYELAIFDAVARGPRSLAELADHAGLGTGRRRLRPLVDVLVAIGALARCGERVGEGTVPARPVVARAGWGLAADVIRSDRPLDLASGELERRYHAHLAIAGAPRARELAPLLDPRSLADLGGGAGAYTAAFLDAFPGSSATLVDTDAVLAIARSELARFGDRVRYRAGDAREVALESEHGTALLANVLHLHGEAACAALCEAAARAVGPGGLVAIEELRVDDDRGGPLASLLFALNMALYTDAGDVHATAQLRAWLAAAGLVELEEHRLASAPDTIVVLARRPHRVVVRAPIDPIDPLEIDAVAGELDAALAQTAPGAALAFPATLRRVLASAIAADRATDGTLATNLVRHYTDAMPRMRVAQRSEPLFQRALDWSRLPRLTGALDRLFAILDDAGVDAGDALGAPTAAAFRARTPTLEALHARTHYGGCMPLLYGYPADLAYFAGRGLDGHALIDRYLTPPLVHELCHLAPARAVRVPLHLDECIGGWLGVHVLPEFAYPAPGEDDAIFAAPWLAQVGQAVARAFGIRALVRAHAGDVTSLPAEFLAAAVRLGDADWQRRRTLHFLSDTLDPAPWIALALVAGTGRALAGETLDSLVRVPLVAFAPELPDDPDFDRAIVEDALRAMCLDNVQIAGSFRARTRLPDAPIAIDAAACRVSSARRGVDTVAPTYWLPPAVGARLIARGITGYALRLEAIVAVPDAAAAICEAAPSGDRAGFALMTS